MIKIIKLALYIHLVLLVGSFIFLISASVIGPAELSPFYRGMFVGMTGTEQSLTDTQIGIFLGTILLPIIGNVLGLVAIHKRSKKLRNIAIGFLTITLINSITESRIGVFPVLQLALFLSKGGKKYFQKNAPESSPLEKGKLENIKTSS